LGLFLPSRHKLFYCLCPRLQSNSRICESRTFCLSPPPSASVPLPFSDCASFARILFRCRPHRPQSVFELPFLCTLFSPRLRYFGCREKPVVQTLRLFILPPHARTPSFPSVSWPPLLTSLSPSAPVGPYAVSAWAACGNFLGVVPTLSLLYPLFPFGTPPLRFFLSELFYHCCATASNSVSTRDKSGFFPLLSRPFRR